MTSRFPEVSNAIPRGRAKPPNTVPAVYPDKTFRGYLGFAALVHIPVPVGAADEVVRELVVGVDDVIEVVVTGRLLARYVE